MNDLLGGNKSRLGAAGLILAGALMIAKAFGWVVLTPEQEAALVQGLTLIGGGVLGLGIAHKLERNTEATLKTEGEKIDLAAKPQ